MLFRFQLVAVLREVKYLELRQKADIPESAINIYEKNETLRQFGQNLDLMVFWYNKVGEAYVYDDNFRRCHYECICVR